MQVQYSWITSHWKALPLKSEGNTTCCFSSGGSFEIQNWMSTGAGRSQRRQTRLTSAFVPSVDVHSCHFLSLFLLALHLPGWNKLSDCWLVALRGLTRDRECQMYLFSLFALVRSAAKGERYMQQYTVLISGDTGGTCVKHDSLMTRWTHAVVSVRF